MTLDKLEHRLHKLLRRPVKNSLDRELDRFEAWLHEPDSNTYGDLLADDDNDNYDDDDEFQKGAN